MPEVQKVHGSAHEWRMVIITSLAISFLAFDRLAVGYLGPFLIKGLGLSNSEFGTIYSVQAVAVALFGVLIGRLSDRIGKRVGLLVPLLVLAGIIAGLFLFVDSYQVMLALRLLSGMALGGISPIIQSILTSQSTSARIGRNIGVQTLLMFLVSQIAGPLMLSRIGERWGWQAGFFASCIPFLVLAIAVRLWLRDPPAASAADAPADVPAMPMPPSARKVVGLCVGVSACFMVWLVVNTTFLPIFLVEHRGFSTTQVGNLMGTLGAGGAIGGLVLPMLSDRLGKQNVLIFGLLLSLLVPLAVLSQNHDGMALRSMLFTGWLAVGVLPIYAVMIPGVAVPGARLAATVGLIVGMGEIVGGVLAPLVAGALADRFSMAAPFWLAAATCAVSVALSLFLARRLRAS